MTPTSDYRDIVSTSTLVAHLDDPTWIIFDCRFDLANPAWGEAEYLLGHIPGAIYAHLDRDLSEVVTPSTGRHPLPDPQVFANRLSSWGIDAGKQVIVYDHAGGTFAVRLWWLLKYYGHERAAVLNGGYPKWLAENRAIDAQVRKPDPAIFIPRLNPQMLISADEVEKHLSDPTWKLMDARTPARYRGEIEPIDTYAGHIPGAVNRFHNDNLQPDSTLLAPEILKQQFRDLLGDTSPEMVVMYCGSGVTSCHHILAMTIAGLPLPRIYAGSWSEWIRDPRRPTEPARAG